MLSLLLALSVVLSIVLLSLKTTSIAFSLLLKVTLLGVGVLLLDLNIQMYIKAIILIKN